MKPILSFRGQILFYRIVARIELRDLKISQIYIACKTKKKVNEGNSTKVSQQHFSLYFGIVNCKEFYRRCCLFVCNTFFFDFPRNKSTKKLRFCFPQNYQWFPTRVPWRGGRGAASYYISMKFWPISLRRGAVKH